jgi:hypothetical protein
LSVSCECSHGAAKAQAALTEGASSTQGGGVDAATVDATVQYCEALNQAVIEGGGDVAAIASVVETVANFTGTFTRTGANTTGLPVSCIPKRRGESIIYASALSETSQGEETFSWSAALFTLPPLLFPSLTSCTITHHHSQPPITTTPSLTITHPPPPPNTTTIESDSLGSHTGSIRSERNRSAGQLQRFKQD